MWIETPRAKTRVECSSAGTKAEVFVIVHWWWWSSASRSEVADLLHAQGKTVYRLDVPWFGQTSMDEVFTVEDYADWLWDCITALPIKNYTLLWHSNGGRMSIAFAARSPAWLKKLILNNAAGIKRRPSVKRRLLKVLTVCFKLVRYLPGMEYARSLFYKLIWGHDYLALDSLYKRETFQLMIASDLAEAMRQITVPTHLIRWSDDTYTPLWQWKEMHELISWSRLTVLHWQKHGIHLHAPKLLVETVLWDD